MENEILVASGCRGVGGIDLGFKQAGCRTVVYIEWSEFPATVLLERMRTGELDAAPIFKDFKRFDGRPWRGKIHIFAAGIPCQPHSRAGKRRGKEDSRNLWPDMARIIGEMDPLVVVVENVEGLYSGEAAYGPEVAAELYGMGYAVVVGYNSAAQEGAPHERMRTFTIGFKIEHPNALGDGQRGHQGSAVVHQGESEQGRQPDALRDDVSDTNHERCDDRSNNRGKRRVSHTEQRGIKKSYPARSGREHRTGEVREVFPNTDSRQREQQDETVRPRRNTSHAGSSELADTHASRSQGQDREGSRRQPRLAEHPGWKTEPGLGRVVNGVSHGLDSYLWGERIKAMGNAVVPQVAESIGRFIKEVCGWP